MKKVCLYCKKEYQINRIKHNKLYCSRECFKKDIENNPTIFKDGHKPDKRLLNQQGYKNCKWMGKNVGYSGLHHWIRKKLGSAKICSVCGKTKKEGKIEWANKNHSYKRNLDDWISLCCKCHAKYDKENNGCVRGGNRY